MPASRPGLAERISARGPAATAYNTGTAPSDATIAAAVAQAQASDQVVVATNNAATSAGQQKLVKQLLATGKPVVVVAVRNPYDIAYFTDAPTYLATYSTTAISVESLARVLFGEVQPAGLLPVSIPDGRRPGRDALPVRPRPDVHVMSQEHDMTDPTTQPGRPASAGGASSARSVPRPPEWPPDRRWPARPRPRPRRAAASRCGPGSRS